MGSSRSKRLCCVPCHYCYCQSRCSNYSSPTQIYLQSIYVDYKIIIPSITNDQSMKKKVKINKSKSSVNSTKLKKVYPPTPAFMFTSQSNTLMPNSSRSISFLS